MTNSTLIFLVLALLVTPVAYITVCIRMRMLGIQRPPYLPLFFVFGTIGGSMLALTSRLIASTVAEYFRRNAEELEINFSLTLNENQFEGAASAGAAGLWDATREGLVRELNRLSGVDPDRLNRGIDTGIISLKSVWKAAGRSHLK